MTLDIFWVSLAGNERLVLLPELRRGEFERLTCFQFTSAKLAFEA